MACWRASRAGHPAEAEENMGAVENRAAVVAAYEAFGRGDVPAVMAMNAPDALWVNYTSQSPLGGEFKGSDEIGTFFVKIGDSIDITQFEMAPIAADGDVVVAAGEQAYTVKSTGKTVAGRVLHVFTFNAEGKVTKFEEFETGTENAFD